MHAHTAGHLASGSQLPRRIKIEQHVAIGTLARGAPWQWLSGNRDRRLVTSCCHLIRSSRGILRSADVDALCSLCSLLSSLLANRRGKRSLHV